MRILWALVVATFRIFVLAPICLVLGVVLGLSLGKLWTGGR